MLIKRIAALLAMTLGFVGIVACLAGIYGVWLVASRLQQANDRIFAAVDKGLVSTQEYLRSVRKGVEVAKVSTAEIDQKLRDWATKEAKERIVTKLEVEARAEHLTVRLKAADSFLDATTDALQGVQQVLELGSSLGAPADPASVKEVLDKLHAVRGSMQQAEKMVDGIREFAAAKEDEPSRLPRVLNLVGRALLTITEVDSHLDESINRLTNMRTDAQASQQNVSRYIANAAIACCLILAWIAAGQAALCVCGWRACRRRRDAA